MTGVFFAAADAQLYTSVLVPPNSVASKDKKSAQQQLNVSQTPLNLRLLAKYCSDLLFQLIVESEKTGNTRQVFVALMFLSIVVRV